MRARNTLLTLLGFVLLGLGALGVALPVLPTTPFVLLAAMCFSAGNQRMLRWLERSRVFGQYIENYRTKQGISAPLKIASIVFLWTGLIISMVRAQTARMYVLLGIVGICVTVHLLWIKTKKHGDGRGPEMKLKGKVALVTGASSGMGRAISLLFAREGATVVAVARRVERLQELEASAAGLHGRIVPRQGDVADEPAMNLIVDETAAEFGTLDILVNNAGIMDEMMPAAEVTDELWDRVMAVNLKAPFGLIRKSLPIMLAKASGVIINVASIGGLLGSRAGAAYTASKFAIVGLTKNVGFMYAQQGIRCNAICPGAVETEISAGIKNPSQFGISRAMAGMGANPRTGSAEEIAWVALFLASEDSSFVNGATLTADGGWSAY